ncbi:GxxExxY protein [Algoriphagus pacificus]|uniref:GxxExxY protein n=1 Tax=Algoriphagus pacificus TaxID=2811234 RepID=A0ABS3CGY1_9BACT|nr:GxxExxY protein [Algoriphagus pacificus]MBN7816343.1 GxxExxY protein [Algoriphagus pacificus]
MLEKEDLTEKILGCAFKVHSKLGPGLLESAYQACLKYELEKEGLLVESEVNVPLKYEEINLDCGFRIDLLVENQVVVELKTVEKFNEVHFAQVLTYLKFTGHKVGLLLNFKTKSLVQGIKRFIL